MLPLLVRHVVDTFYSEAFGRWEKAMRNTTTEVATESCQVGQMTEFLLKEVVKGTAELVSHWQAIGFVHGVCQDQTFFRSIYALPTWRLEGVVGRF